nr:putative reverse transcriptase domain-containing protein [Tanacetum cinerariifolium]
EILEVNGERPEGNLKQLKTIKVNELKLEDILVVRKFIGVFPKELSGLPSSRELEFLIDLIPRAMSVAKSPYRLAPTKMQEQKTREQMEEEDNKALKRTSESQAEKAAKKQKLDEEVEELNRHLQIVPNDDDDVYTEATPLARTVPVVDYEIYTENNKPCYKIIRADGSP